MLEGYKILRAIGGYGDRPFTVAEITTRTAISEATVRTVLARDRGLLEEVGRVETGRRGGRPKQYRVSAEARASLEARLAALDGLAAPAGDQREQGVPDALLASEETLLSPDERDLARLRHEIAIGWLGYDAGTRAAETLDGEQAGELAKHLRIVKALLSLAELEERTLLHDAVDLGHIAIARELFETLKTLDLGSETHAALDARLKQSPVGDSLAPPRVRVMVTGAAEQALSQVVDLLHDYTVVFQEVGATPSPPRERAQFGVLVIGHDSAYEERDLDWFADEPVIIVDAFAQRPELARPDHHHRSVLYVKGVPQLTSAVSFARHVGDSWLSVGQRLLGD